MKQWIALLLSVVMVFALCACGDNSGKTPSADGKPDAPASSGESPAPEGAATAATEKTGESVKMYQGIPEKEVIMLESTGKYTDDELLFRQMNWDEFEVKTDDIEFMGLPGSAWSIQTILEKTRSAYVDVDNQSLPSKLEADALPEFDGVLTESMANSDGEYRSDENQDLRDSRGSLGGDMSLGMRIQEADWGMNLSFPSHDHDVKLRDALAGDCYYFDGVEYFDSFNTRSSFVFTTLGGEFHSLLCPENNGVATPFAGEFVEHICRALGRPTGLIKQKDKEFTNYYYWFLYWDRGSYVITLRMEDNLSGSGNSVRFLPPRYYTRSAFDFALEETLASKDNYELIVLDK